MGRKHSPLRHVVISIGGEYGSGGPEIGRLIADDLGIAYYDRGSVDAAALALDTERSRERLGGGTRPEVGPNAPLAVDASAVSVADPSSDARADRFIRLQLDAIRALAEQSCVIVGRCGNYALEGVEDCLDVFVYAPEELRLQAVMNSERLSGRKALETLRARDRQLHEQYRRVTGTNRGDRRHRDLMIDSSVLGWARTARLIESFVEMAGTDR